jgi:hypothetical protein
VYALQGRIVADVPGCFRGMNAGAHTVSWKLLGIASGVYVVHMNNGKKDTEKSIILAGWRR